MTDADRILADGYAAIIAEAEKQTALIDSVDEVTSIRIHATNTDGKLIEIRLDASQFPTLCTDFLADAETAVDAAQAAAEAAMAAL